MRVLGGGLPAAIPSSAAEGRARADGSLLLMWSRVRGGSERSPSLSPILTGPASTGHRGRGRKGTPQRLSCWADRPEVTDRGVAEVSGAGAGSRTGGGDSEPGSSLYV
eukprot:g11737.t1